MGNIRLILSTLLIGSFCGSYSQARPEFPIRNIDTRTVQKINGKYETTTPHLPVHDMTLDGRIGLTRRQTHAGSPNLSIFLMKPKKVKNHLKHPSNPKLGANLIQGGAFKGFNIKDLLQRYFPVKLKGYNAGRTIICEKTDLRKSPFVCDDGKSDCYRVTFVTRHIKELGRLDKIRQTAIDVIIKVKNPKTLSASIQFVYPLAGSRKISQPMDLMGLSEPVIVGDGRLLIARVYDTDIGGVGRTNIAYSAYPERFAQCDPTRWTSFSPISHAHHDPNMRKRYKFARYQLRDGLGNKVPDGHDLGGSYQWMDKDAANLFFWAYGLDRYYNEIGGVVKGIYPEQSSTEYYTSAIDLANPGEVETNSLTAGLSMAGFWTHGKTITFDGLLNNSDYNFQISNKNVSSGEMTRKIKLYNGTPRGEYFEKLGMQRERGNEIEFSKYHYLLSPNSSFIGSIENRLNYIDSTKPVTPRDVVWHFGSTRHSEEIAFDDFMSPYFLINAEMTAAVGLPNRSKQMTNFDGYKRGQRSPASIEDFEHDNSVHPLAFQNASSAPESFMKVPQAGSPIGHLRVEPIAKGGIHGKGLWLHPKAGLEFKIPDQAGADFNLQNQKNWYMGLFIDARYNKYKQNPKANIVKIGNKTIRLVKWKGGPANKAVAYDAIQLLEDNAPVGYFKLPNRLRFFYKHWKHLGIDFGIRGGASVFINGFRLGNFMPSKGKSIADIRNFFRPKENQSIILGSHTSSHNPGLKGWVDDFKVIARSPSVVEKCNYARGTLVQVDSADPWWMQLAEVYPKWQHRYIASQVGATGKKRYACFILYGKVLMKNRTSKEVFAHLKNISPSMVSVREKLVTQRKPLKFGKPRPGHIGNRFCLSCHVSPSMNKNKELNTDALVWRGWKDAENDPRRQPMQPDRFIRGVIPANYFGNGKPGRTLTGKDKHLIDQWILPH